MYDFVEQFMDVFTRDVYITLSLSLSWSIDKTDLNEPRATPSQLKNSSVDFQVPRCLRILSIFKSSFTCLKTLLIRFQ